MAIIPRREGGQGDLSRRTTVDPFELMQDFVRWDPLRELTRLTGRGEIGFVPSFDVKETKDAYVFKADLPGVREEDLDVSLTGNRLTISGRREEERREEGEQMYAYERSYGSFTRSFTLPEGIDSEHVDAELKEGVLSVRIPKTPEVQPRRIQLRGRNDKGSGAKA